ncbi:MAG: hypothetical protein WCY15_14750 [Phenylobacterium sp.]|uniref:hypothetical protein n=1 Tax=Phenylobacterium sp. TaxID=1871053 RepID=UPI002A3145D2|nr:hypothetical protein [Phenylobacterium sp.]MDD3836579.1 hypothetical protein [Phenylobacterium sp.]MDX9999547.1 hypothetical protein [Phenylobacterium sp.]
MHTFNLRSATLIAIVFSLSACERKPEATATPQAAAPGVERPALWSIEVMSGDKAVSRVDICADGALRAGFARPAPEVDGKPCVRVKGGDREDGTYSALCRADDQLYRVGAVTTGDPASDFSVQMAATRQDRKGPKYEQVRRYRRLGPCPSGWHIGDSAAPGAKELLDTITDKRRPMPAAGG